jgi:peptide/nickel transport system substrate-binding protein
MSGRRFPFLRRAPLGAIVAATLLAASGCAVVPSSPSATAPSSPSPGPSQAATPGDPTPRGGTAVYAVPGDIPSWDPCYTPPGATVSEQLSAVYGVLMWTDISGTVQPGMASSLTSADGATWTLKLHSGLRFTDGTAFDADAVKYNWDRAADAANACTQQSWVASWSALTVVDSTTLTVKLKSADSSFPARIAELLPFIGSPTALQASRSRVNLEPVGAGPFRLVAWNPGVQSTLDRNAGYWDAPRPYLDRLIFRDLPEPASRVQAVVDGGADYTVGYLDQFGTAATAAGVTTREIAAPGLDILWFNAKGGPSGLMNDPRARAAVAAAIDPRGLVAALTRDPTIKAPDSLFPAPSPYHDPSLAYGPYSPSRAQGLIDVVVASGRRFEFTIAAPDSPDMIRAAVYLQQTMNGYGNVRAELLLVPAAGWRDVCQKQGRMDVCLSPEVVTLNPAELTARDLLHSGGPGNVAHNDDPELDAALDASLAAGDEAARVAAWSRIQQLYLRDLPFWAYGLQHQTMLIRDSLGGVVNYSQAATRVDLLYRCP